jgi:hypothetical protein
MADLPSKNRVTVIALEERLKEQIAIKTGQALKPVRSHPLRKTQDYLEAAHRVGAILGNRLYHAFQSNELSQDTWHRWLKTPVDSRSSFLRFYVSVLDQLKKVPFEVRSKYERL